MGDTTAPPGAESRTVTLQAPPVQLPDPSGLSQQQVRGRACVWCAVALNNATAHDLGTHYLRRFDTAFAWFPRSCRPCTVVAAHKALLDHSENCLQCYDNQTRCTEGGTLRQTLKEARR